MATHVEINPPPNSEVLKKIIKNVEMDPVPIELHFDERKTLFPPKKSYMIWSEEAGRETFTPDSGRGKLTFITEEPQLK